MNLQFENYFVKALHDAKVNELVETYAKRGYRVKERPSTASEQFDLVLQDPMHNKTIAFEVKLLPIDNKKTEQINTLKQRALENGYEFRLVTIARPSRYEIEIEWLDQALLQFLMEEPLQEINELATHVRYENVDVSVDSLRVAEETAFAKVHGSLEAELQYGSSSDIASDIGLTMSHTFNFEGILELDISHQTVNSADINIDLSDWDGE
jgi:Predicted pPIWI-associating nuclease